jgi:Cu/Ag efflux pump CusA
VVGGMLAATFIATIFIPLLFVLVARHRRRHAAAHAT